jgi:preprotein translocase subunit SecG
MTFLDHDDAAATERSLASDITPLDDVEFQGDVPALVPVQHDQLPSIEEYKAQQTSTKVLGTIEIDQADDVHDQLPSIEDYKIDHEIKPMSSGKKTLRCLGITLLVLVATVAIIVVPVVLLKDDSDDGGLFGNGNNNNNLGNPNNPSKSVSRIPAVADYLQALDISTMALMNSEGTPQNRALKWIADDDAYQLALPETTTSIPSGSGRLLLLPGHNPFVERYSLVVFYYSLGGPEWTYQYNFLQPTDHCNWYQNFLRSRSRTIVRLGVKDCQNIDGVNYVSRIGARK